MRKIFYKDESAVHPGKYLIRVKLEEFNLDSTTGSFSIIAARLFGITYAQYLRMCRDHYGAEIYGKSSNYPVAYFKLSKELDSLIAQLNERANLILEGGTI